MASTHILQQLPCDCLVACLGVDSVLELAYSAMPVLPDLDGSCPNLRAAAQDFLLRLCKTPFGVSGIFQLLWSVLQERPIQFSGGAIVQERATSHCRCVERGVPAGDPVLAARQETSLLHVRSPFEENRRAASTMVFSVCGGTTSRFFWSNMRARATS